MLTEGMEVCGPPWPRAPLTAEPAASRRIRTSFGTLFAFVLVSIGVWILRVKAPNIERPFKTPAAPVVGTLGALICTAMIAGLDKQTLTVAFIWMAVGLVVYFLYSKHNSKLRNPSDIIPKASDFE